MVLAQNDIYTETIQVESFRDISNVIYSTLSSVSVEMLTIATTVYAAAHKMFKGWS